MAVGPGYICEATGELIPMTAKVDDIIMYAQGTGSPIILEDEVFVVLKERDIFGIITS